MLATELPPCYTNWERLFSFRLQTLPMARRKSARRTRARPNPLEQVTAALLRPEVAGIALFMLSAFTLLSLITGSRGQITGAWIELLQQFVGMGVWGLPLVAGILGLWIVIRAVERMPDLPWQRPAGFFLVFIAYLIGSVLRTSSDPLLVGGWLGVQLSTTLSDTLGPWGAWAAVSFLAIFGIILLTDRFLVELAYEIWLRYNDFWAMVQERRRHPTVQPELPIPSGKLPLWKRLRDRFAPQQSDASSPNLVHPRPSSRRSEPSRATAGVATQQKSAPGPLVASTK